MWQADPLRKLACSPKWVTLYARAKDCNIDLFKNKANLTPLQVRFLQWLDIYYNLYIDLACDKEYLDEDTIQDEILCDAYLIYDRKQREEENKTNKGKSKTKKKKPTSHGEIPSISFVNK